MGNQRSNLERSSTLLEQDLNPIEVFWIQIRWIIKDHRYVWTLNDLWTCSMGNQRAHLEKSSTLLKQDLNPWEVI